jgi:hypothetical protein
VLVSADGNIHPIDIVMGRPDDPLKERLLSEFGIGMEGAGATTTDGSSVSSIFFEGGPER